MSTLSAEPTSFNEKSSHTADSVAYRRTFTSIPFSKEIFEILEDIVGPIDPHQKERADSYPIIMPLFESRYIVTDREIRKAGITQILELASGLSPRGFVWAQDPAVTVVEIDLPEKMRLKKRIIERLHGLNGTSHFAGLHLVEGNVTNPHTVAAAGSYFLPSLPVAVVCEGLLRYMDWEDKEALVESVRTTLQVQQGGMWVTPDIELLSDITTPAAHKRYDEMVKTIGMDVRPNLFRDMEHAVEFFQGFGFKVSIHRHTDVISELTSPKALGLSAEAVHEELSKRFTFTMSL